MASGMMEGTKGCPMNRRLSRRVLTAAMIATAGELCIDKGLVRSSPATPASTTLPETPAGRQLQWVIDVMNGVEPIPSEQVIGEHFGNDFLAQVPATQMVSAFVQFASQFSDVHVLEIVGMPAPLMLDVVIETGGVA